MQLSSKIVRNSIANYAGNVAGLVVGFLLTPFLVHALGDSQYGAWVLVGSLGSYFWLLDFGLGASVTKFVSQLRATGEQERLNSVVATSIAMLSAVGLVSLAGSIVLAQMVDLLFRLPPEIVPEVRTMIYVTGVALMVSFPLGVFGGVLRGYQRYDLINLVGAVSITANAALSVLAVKLGFGLVGLSAVGLLTNLMVGGGRMALATRLDRSLVLRASAVRLSTLRDITGFSVWVFVINIAVQVVYRTAPVIIGALLSVAQVTPYAIANSLAQYLRRFVDPILAVLLPAYSELSAVEDSVRVRQLFLGGSKIVGAISMPTALGLVLLGKPFIALWMGPDYEQAGVLLYFLVPPVFLSFLVATGDKLLWAKGKVRVNSHVAVADTVLNLTLSVSLARPLGLVGVAMAPFFSVLVTNGLWLLPYICREAGVPVRVYLSSVARPLLLAAVPSTAAALLLRQLVGTGSYLHILLLGAVCVTTFWLAFYLVSDKQEKAYWVSAVRNAIVPSSIPGEGEAA
ncbi:MAG: oligosaccharide flippase family protein [Chloroflexota bacterium]